MSIYRPILIFAILFATLVILRIIQNAVVRKKLRRKRTLFSTKDLGNVLFNVGILTGGLTSVGLALGYGMSIFGTELQLPQSIINFCAGVLFVWFAIRNIFYGGKV